MVFSFYFFLYAESVPVHVPVIQFLLYVLERVYFYLYPSHENLLHVYY